MEEMSVPPNEPWIRRLSPVAFALVSLTLIFFLYQFVAGGVTLLLANGKVTEDNVSLIRWSTIIGQLLCILLPTLLLARRRHGNLVEFFRFSVPTPQETVVTIVAVFALQQMAQGYMAMQDAIPLPAPVKTYVDIFKKLFEETYRVLVQAHSPWEFMLVVVTVAVVPALSEELLFRGLVQRSVEEATGGLKAAIIAGVIFGAYHLNPFSIVPLAALGIYFGFIVYRSRSIIVAIAAHFFNNFVACVAIYLQLDDDFVAIAPGSTPTAQMIVANFALFTLVFVGATMYFIHLTSEEE
jgi:membrane protease YdiL (CAAX protease family)